MQNLLITGSTGYIGSSLIRSELFKKFNLYHTTRNLNALSKNEVYLDLEKIEDFSCPKVDIVIHCAGLAHSEKYDEKDFNKVNNISAIKLAKKALDGGTKLFIFISTAGVYGRYSNSELTENSEIFNESPYTYSKLRAEEGLMEISKNSAMDIIIVRPPLVYGLGAPGNCYRLDRLIQKNIPLPFLLLNNKRSFCYIDKLVQFLYDCCTRKKNDDLKNNIFNICDDEPMSTKDFSKMLGKLSNKTVFLIPVPIFILKLIFYIFGKKRLSDSLLRDMVLSNKKSKEIFTK